MIQRDAGSPECSASPATPHGSKPGKGSGERNVVSPSGSVPPPKHPKEEVRLAELHQFMESETMESSTLDSLVRLAATICDTPSAYISMVDKDDQTMVSRFGIDLQKTSTEDSFCGYTILNSERMFIVPDTTKDPRFAANPFVTGPPYIRFYAGAPIAPQVDLAIGSLCVIDTRPRELTAFQQQMLSELSHVAMNVLQAKRNNSKMKAMSELTHSLMNRLISFSQELVSRSSSSTDDLINDMISHLDPSLEWISARIIQGNKEITRLIDNPSKSSRINTGALWRKVDRMIRHERHEHGGEKHFKSGIPDKDFALMMFPIHSVSARDGAVEMIIPNHLKHTLLNSSLLELMCANVGIVLDREIMNINLRHQASHDPLTGAANRTLFLSKLSETIKATVPGRMDSALFFIDLDDFKDVNDNFGHQTGDELLIAIAERLIACSRENDLVGRLSGDEFVLLANDIGNEEVLEHMLGRLNETFEEPLKINSNLLKITASIGCVPISTPSISVERVMQQVEGVMYLVKNGHRKGICVADEEILRTIRYRRSMMLEVKEALNRNRLSLYAQPLIDLDRGAIVGAEFLLRITGRNGAILPADAFMSSIERSHYLVTIDEWVFREALGIMKGLKSHLIGIDDFRISINVTPAILNTLNYGSQCISIIREHGIDPAVIVMEITENNLIPLAGRVIDNLHSLRDGGVRIAVDDFGTGYSNLQSLSTLPLDILKIDRTLVTGSSGILKREALLGATMAIAKNLDLEIVAEGVETKEDEDLIRSLGCRYAQGFFYGRPMPMDHFLNLLQRQSFLSEFSEVLAEPQGTSPSRHSVHTADKVSPS